MRRKSRDFTCFKSQNEPPRPAAASRPPPPIRHAPTSPSKEQTMRDAVTALVKALGARVGVGKKLASGWGPAPDVDGDRG